MTLTLSVIIPFYERLADVMRCLSSLQTLATPDVLTEFLVQDDCSPTVNLSSLMPPCAASVQRNAVNLGFGGNCNAAAARARGDVLFFVNQDVYALPMDADGYPLSQRWNAALLGAFSQESVGIVGAKLLFPQEFRIQSAGGLYDIGGQPFHRCLGYGNHLYEEVNTPQKVSWVTGAALAIRKDLFLQLGGFDEAYGRGYFEDVDLCERVKQAGYSVMYEPSCALMHEVGTSGGNPAFYQNAQEFKRRWVDSGIVQADVYTSHVKYW